MRRPAHRSLHRLTAVVVALGALGIATVSAQQQQPARRMIVLLFDVGSLQPDDLVRASEASVRYVDESMTGTDLVSVVALGSRLNVVADFTSDPAQLKTAIGALRADADAARNAGALIMGLYTLCETLRPIQQKKAVLFFSSGMQRSGGDIDGEAMRGATNACNRGNVSLYPVDARGLVAAVAGQAL